MNGHDSRERPVVFPYEGEVVRCPVRRAVEAVAILAVPYATGRCARPSKPPGRRFRFLPPYTPDFNPIEQAFAKLKAFLRAPRPRNFDHVTALVAAALALFTPEIDLTESGDSFDTNAGVDYVLVDRLTDSIALYAGDHDLTDPYLSPIFGDVTGFPPTFVQAGTRDLFLSNAVRIHRKLRDAGVDAELHIWEAMPHGGFFGAPEDAEMGAEVRRFLAKHV